MNPIPEPIAKSNLSVAVADIVKIPNSGTQNQYPARLNFLTHAGDNSDRLFVNDMRGWLYIIENQQVSVYLNLKTYIGNSFFDGSGQMGFSYFVFHPKFATNGIFYTVHSENKGSKIPDFAVTKPIYNNQGQLISSSHHDVILEWKTTNPQADTFAGSFREVLRIEQPYRDHNVGQLAFNPNAFPGSPDYGMLYIAVADGGSDGFPVADTDPLDNGQDLNTPLGKILRIHPQGTNSANSRYGIPVDNPFVADNKPQTLGEIWAYGLRNPHRISWDTEAEEKMLIVDIGQAYIEEIDLGIKGANYGWGNREGTWVIDENQENVLYKLPADDAQFGYTYPVAQYDHDIPPGVTDSFGFAIAGGYVYRGSAIPELAGQYIFADFSNDGRFFHVPIEQLKNGQQAKIKELRLFQNNQQKTFLEIVGSHRSDVRFGTDETGEIYVTSKSDGMVRKLIQSPEFANPVLISINSITVLEGSDATAQFTITLSQASQQIITVQYTTNDNTAKAGSDYLAKTGTLIFNPGQTSQKIAISLVDDDLSESHETFRLILSDANHATIKTGTGTGSLTDTLSASVTTTLPITIENLTLTGNNLINGTGNSYNNRLQGNNNNNKLDGLNGNDRLLGLLGNDTLIGGRGNDTLIGGKNNDVFLLQNVTDKLDTISDFMSSIDKIHIKASGFAGGLTKGTLSSDRFVLGSTALASFHQFIYEQSTGSLFFDRDGVGSLAKVKIATLSNKVSLKASDIVII